MDGNESNILAFLPVTPGTRLNSTSYVYERDNAWRVAKNTIVSEVEFNVTSNISEKVDVNILLDLALEYLAIHYEEKVHSVTRCQPL